jgi:hypothetical protein
MGRVVSFGLDRVLERIMLISGAARRRAAAPSASSDSELRTGQRRILEHVAMTSVEKRLKMPR